MSRGRRLNRAGWWASRWALLLAGIAVAAVAGLFHTSRTTMHSAAAVSRTGLVGPLVVSGSSVVDQGTGKTVDLKGVNSPPNRFDPASITTVVDWGANFARVWVSDDRYVQACSNEAYDKNYVSEVDTEVNALTADGVYVVIVDGSTNPNCAFNSPQHSGVAPLPGSQALAMFASLARTFGSNPLVGFEPYNEPQVCPDGAQEASPLVPQNKLDPDLALAYPANALVHPTSPTSVPTFGTCDGWKGGYPNASYSNWSQEQADKLSAYALFSGGTVQILTGLSLVTYTGEGFETIANTLRGNGATSNLIFVDANMWSAYPATFDYISSTATCGKDAAGQPFSPCWANLQNYVAAYHYYNCQWTTTSLGVARNTCDTPTPESCALISSNLSHLLTDPATGTGWGIPVVLDEFGWPQAAQLPTASLYQTTKGTVVLVYQHGLFMQNVVSYLDQHHTGWAGFSWDNGDQNAGWQGPYVLESNSPLPTSTNTPWAPNVDGQPLQQSMQGQVLPCQEPPPGFG